MEGPAPQQVQTTTVPKGTFRGGASTGEATALAQMVAASNNNTVQAFDRAGDQMKVTHTDAVAIGFTPAR